MIGKRDFSFLIGRQVVLIRFAGELGIKSHRTRRRMLENLRSNLRQFLDPSINPHIRKFRGRFVVYTDQQVDLTELALKIAGRLSGISSVSPALVVKSTESEIIEAGVVQSLPHIPPNSAFSVRARREGSHDFSSMKIAAALGTEVLKQTETGVRVDLTNPDFTIYLDIRGPLTFIYTQNFPGIGGLPAKAQGTIISLIRPHYNSILTSWLMQKRGAEVIPVFFKTGKPSEEKYLEFVKVHLGPPKKIISLEDALVSLTESLSSCLSCEVLSEAICQEIAKRSGISTCVAPTCFDFNQEKTSLDALKLLEQHSSPKIMRPIQFGYLGQTLGSESLDHTPCCLYQDKVSLQILEEFSRKDLEKIIALKSRLLGH